jgi:hypothetical protein
MKMIYAMCAATLLLSMMPADSEEDKEWKLRFRKEGISVYSSKHVDSQIDDLKGECLLDASLETVARVMLDVSSYPQWVADCEEARKFNCTDLYTCKLYLDLAMPWPVRDRDIVLQSSTDMNLSDGWIVGAVYALSDELIPVHKNRIRIKSMHGKWVFKRISANKTMATFTIWADPAGLIPPIVINIASIDIPFRTLQGLRRMVRKENYAKDDYSLHDKTIIVVNETTGNLSFRSKR